VGFFAAANDRLDLPLPTTALPLGLVSRDRFSIKSPLAFRKMARPILVRRAKPREGDVMGQSRRRAILGMMAAAAGIAVLGGKMAWPVAQADEILGLDARIVAFNIPGASAIAQVGTFLNDSTACSRPIPTRFPSFIQPGAVLDPNRLLVGSTSNFGAGLADGV